MKPYELTKVELPCTQSLCHLFRNTSNKNIQDVGIARWQKVQKQGRDDQVSIQPPYRDLFT